MRLHSAVQLCCTALLAAAVIGQATFLAVAREARGGSEAVPRLLRERLARRATVRCTGWDCEAPVQRAGGPRGVGGARLAAAPLATSVRARASTTPAAAEAAASAAAAAAASPAASAAAPAAPAAAGAERTPISLLCAGRATKPPARGLSMSAYIRAGGRLPIMIVTSDRAEMLERTLANLLPPLPGAAPADADAAPAAAGHVRCVTRDDVIVISDGEHAGVGGVIAAAGVRSHAHVREAGGMDGAARIASHYRYALAHALDVAFPGAPGVIIVEDDFLFAPDFFEYFHAAAFALDAFPESLWVASAWNDNGFDYLVADPGALRRTSYFPGLGWLLPRRVWEGELAASWPSSHWDHWMRDPARRRGRDVVIPEVNRVYHAGVRGTFMDSGTHNALFGSIALQADDAFTWDSPAGARALDGLALGAYAARLAALLAAPGTLHLGAGGRGGLGPLAALLALPPGATAAVWYVAPPNVANHDPMRPLAAFFGIWHEGGRGSWRGVHELWWGPAHARLLLVNAHAPDGGGGGHVSGTIEAAPVEIARLRPAGVAPIPWGAFASDAQARARPLLPRHAGLFGGKFASPLAHLEGGADANGPPDVGGEGEGRVGGQGERRARDRDEPPPLVRQHETFMGDLRLALPGMG